MSESITPICDLIEKLLSRELSRESLGHSLEVARPIEAALLRTATGRKNPAEVRKIEAERKAAYRAGKRGIVLGTDAEGIFSNPQNNKRKTVKKESDVPGQAGTDDWPADYVEQFWKAFPPYRRQAKAKVSLKLARIRADGKVTWEMLFGGVVKFAGTQPGEYAPAPMVWLNDGRWDREYGTGGSNGKTQAAGSGKVGFSGIAARLRAQADGELPIDEPPGGTRR